MVINLSSSSLHFFRRKTAEPSAGHLYRYGNRFLFFLFGHPSSSPPALVQHQVSTNQDGNGFKAADGEALSPPVRTLAGQSAECASLQIEVLGKK